MLLLLRAWVGLVAVMAAVNAVQCFLDPQFPQKRIYTLKPDEASPLFSRMFGTWTMLAAVVRFAFAASPRNKGLFLVTMISFLMPFVYFASEVFVYQTADLSFGSIAPLVIAGTSMLWMSFMWPLISESVKQKKVN